MNVLKKIFMKIDYYINSIYNTFLLIIKHVKVGQRNRINGRLIISCEKMNADAISLPRIIIGNNCRMNSGMTYNLIGGQCRLILRTVDEGSIKIGDNVGMSNCVIVSMHSVTIDDDVTIGGDVRIYDNDFHSIGYEERMKYPDLNIKKKKVHIKKGAFIGTGTIVLKGVTIGEQSVVGAGSVVTKNVPDREIWAGNPCRFVRKVYEA